MMTLLALQSPYTPNAWNPYSGSKGFDFGKVPTGEVIFMHASVVRGAEVLMIGTDAWVQAV